MGGDQLDAGANGVAVARSALEAHDEEVGAGRRIIAAEANARPVAVGGPDVQVAVMVPVGQGQATPVVEKVEARDVRHVGEAAPPSVQERTVAFTTAPRCALERQRVQTSVGALKGTQLLGVLLANFVR